MSLVDDLRAASTPRPAKLQGRVARRIDGITGFILFGVLYLAVVANSVVIGATIAMIQLDAPELAIAVVAVCAFVASWIPFVLWIRHRQKSARELARTGAFVDGKVVRWTHSSKSVYVTILLSNGKTIINLLSPGLTERAHPVGSGVDVLFSPGNRYALYFSDSGQGIGASVIR